MQRRLLSSDTLAFLLIAVAAAVLLWWMCYTQYIEEDAYITFRYAEQIAMGNGFVYNIAERVYGTTTPLFTIILSLWLIFISNNIILGANILNLIAAISIPIITWKTLKSLQRSRAEQYFTLIVMLLSPNFIDMNTQGMETSLSVSLLAASWYTWVNGKPKLTGLLCGLLLWTRIDSVFWVIILVLATLISNRRNAASLGITAVITYLPWVVFAIIYFGSPIPHTITAKWAAYSQFNQTSYLTHLATIFKYLSSFRDQIGLQVIGIICIFGVTCWGIWKNRAFQEKAFYILIIFALFEITRLTITRATFFNRYFIPILWLTLILFGVGLGTLWDRIRIAPISRAVFLSLFALFVISQAFTGISFAQNQEKKQTFRHESSLKAMGLWLKNNTSPQSTVLLEPLGYVGYYSERVMIDEVGLVTPYVTELKLQQIRAVEYVSIFQPDYIIVHCDETSRLQSMSDQSYHLTEIFNPLGFQTGVIYSSGLPRSSCYQIWEK